MNYVKTIKRNIMQEAAGKGLITGGIISLLVSLFLMFLRLNPGFIVPMADTLGICAICVLLFLLFSLRSSLMNLGIAADSLRSYAEQHEDAALRRSTAATNAAAPSASTASAAVIRGLASPSSPRTGMVSAQ